MDTFSTILQSYPYQNTSDNNHTVSIIIIIISFVLPP